MEPRKRQPSRPLPFDEQQFNFCLNTLCENYGVAPLTSVGTGRGAIGDFYRMVGGTHRSELRCMRCMHQTRLKSNQAAVEEFLRYRTYLQPAAPPSCPRETCAGQQTAIQRFGTTPTGSVRYRCAACSRTFSIPIRATWKQKASTKNEIVLKLLVNKMPMRRILEVADISASTLYRKLAFSHAQCVRFAARHEARLPGMDLGHVRVGSDQQTYLINWGSHIDRRNFALRALVTADNGSGFVFAVHPNFDPETDPMTVEREARLCGDNDLPPQHRRHARLWLARDYLDVSKERRDRSAATDRSQPTAGGDLHEEDMYDEAGELKRPTRGMQVHQAYVFLGHFQFLRHLLQGASRLSIAVDPDSGLKQGALAVFHDAITAGRCRVFELNIAKGATVDDKELAVMQAMNALDRVRADFAGMNRDAAAVLLAARQLAAWKNSTAPAEKHWIDHPLPNRAEPRLRVLPVSPRAAESVYAVAQDVVESTIRNTDRFFMIVRRRLSLLERPIKTPSSASRSWHAYSPYDPAIACRVVETLRVVFNYHLAGKDKQTPAMRLGLADRPYSLAEILAEPRVAAVNSRRKQTA